MRPDLGLALALTVGVFAACADEPAGLAPAASDAGTVATPDAAAPYDDAGDGDFVWQLPAGFPKPKIPADNPMSRAKVELGRRLFYDTALSENRTQSCASCHLQALAFTDGLTHSVGSTGQLHPRSAQSLVNVGYASTLTWQNDLLGSLEIQGRVPLFGDEPVELGMRGREDELLARLRERRTYREAFPAAFPDEAEPLSIKGVLYALSAFERSIVSGDAPIDRFTRGEPNAVDASVKRGRALFDSERMECFHCHGGFNFADATSHEGTGFVEKPYHNNALYNLDGQGSFPAASRGLIDVSGKPEDMGRFKAPSLRNVAVTAPYMHDGSIATLEEVIDHYARGGRRITEGPNAGDGAASPLKSEFVVGFVISPEEKADLVAFLHALTDTAFLSDPRFSDPGPAD